MLEKQRDERNEKREKDTSIKRERKKRVRHYLGEEREYTVETAGRRQCFG